MKRILSMLLSLALIWTMLPGTVHAANENSTQLAEYQEAGKYIQENIYKQGDLKFDEYYDKEITRSLVAEYMCFWILGQDISYALVADYAPYNDVPVSNWASGFIAYCKYIKLMDGDNQGDFHPADTISIGECARIVMQVCRDKIGAYQGSNGVSQALSDAEADKILPSNYVATNNTTLGDLAYMIFRSDVRNGKARASTEPTYSNTTGSSDDSLSGFERAIGENVLQDKEDNSSASKAQSIVNKQTIFGTLKLPDSYKGQRLPDGTLAEDYMDLDYYTFTLTQDSSILVGVFPEDYKSDDYIMAVISDSNDTSIVGTTSYNVEGSYMGSILGYQLKAGKYYLTILSSKDSSKYNGAKYGCYFEAIPSSGNSGQSTGGYSSGSLNNFKKVNNYTVGQFKDVPASKWCAANVQTAYEYNLMQGKSDTYFDTDGNLTIAQAIVMACRLHSIYYGTNYNFQKSEPWYQDYVDYALEYGILDGTQESYDTPVTRAGFAKILSGALPDSALQRINNVTNIPDVSASESYAPAVYRLYNAGILTGNDVYGVFTPFSKITRGAAAAIVSRMANETLRKEFSLQIPQYPTSISISKTSVALYGGQNCALTVSTAPANAVNATVTWSSSNTKVATVSSSGVVTARNVNGSAVITAKTANGKTVTCKVTVTSISDNYLAQKAYDKLKSVVKFPDTLKIYNVWAYDLNSYRKIEIDYSAENSYGQSVREFYVVTFLQDGTIYVTDSKTSSPHRNSGFLGTNLRQLSTKNIKK